MFSYLLPLFKLTFLSTDLTNHTALFLLEYTFNTPSFRSLTETKFRTKPFRARFFTCFSSRMTESVRHFSIIFSISVTPTFFFEYSLLRQLQPFLIRRCLLHKSIDTIILCYVFGPNIDHLHFFFLGL